MANYAILARDGCPVQAVSYRSNLEMALLIAGMAAGLILLAVGFIYMISPIFWVQSNTQKARGQWLPDSLVRVIVACGAAGFVYLYVVLVDTIIRLLGTVIRETLVTNPIIIGIFSLFLGCLIYFIRYKFRFYYGLVEVLFGVIVTTKTSQISDGAALLQVLAGIYVIVRGLDNMERGAIENKSLKSLRDKLFGQPA